MYLVQLLLPVRDNQGQAISGQLFETVRRELTERFGGLTVYSRAPADGTWQDSSTYVHDELLLFEVMLDAIDHSWWRKYRRLLEDRFEQEEILIRSFAVEKL